MIVVIIMGGIFFGIFIVIEFVVIVCLWLFFVIMFIYCDYKWLELFKLMYCMVKIVIIVMILIGFVVSFGVIMIYM